MPERKGFPFGSVIRLLGRVKLECNQKKEMATDMLVLEHATISDKKGRSVGNGCCNIGPGYATPLEAMAGPRETLIYVTSVYSGTFILRLFLIIVIIYWVLSYHMAIGAIGF